MSYDPDQSLTFQWKILQRAILKYLIFLFRGGPSSLFIFIFIFNFNFHLLFKFLINFNFIFLIFIFYFLF